MRAAPRFQLGGAENNAPVRLGAILPPSPLPRRWSRSASTPTFSVDMAAAEARPLDVPLVAPSTISSSRLEAVSTVALRVELSSSSVGWGEAPALLSITAEDQLAALAAALTVPLGVVFRDVALALALPGQALASMRHSNHTLNNVFTLHSFRRH